VTLTLTDAYAPQRPRTVRLKAGRRQEVKLDTGTHGWYDLTLTVAGSSFLRQVAGHLDDGRPSTSDPALGRRP
jgi:phospholipase C